MADIERDLKVLIVEDEPCECEALVRCVNNTDGIRLAGVTNSAAKALEYVKDSLPEAVILDIELHKGGGNGISFLRRLRELDLRVFPFILVTTNNISAITLEMARRAGADFIISKYQEDYSAESVIEFLISAKSMIQRKNRQSMRFYELPPHEEREERRKRLLKKINAEFDLIGISPKMVGRKYLTDAVQSVMTETAPYIAGEIAKKHGKTTSSVERAMQTAITSAWRGTGIEDIIKYYTARINPARGAPTVMEFVHFYANKLGEG